MDVEFPSNSIAYFYRVRVWCFAFGRLWKFGSKEKGDRGEGYAL